MLFLYLCKSIHRRPSRYDPHTSESARSGSERRPNGRLSGQNADACQEEIQKEVITRLQPREEQFRVGLRHQGHSEPFLAKVFEGSAN